MRTTLGILAILGIGVSAAVAQQPASPIARPRAATLLPPIPLAADDAPLVARGVAEEVPSNTNTSPVTPPRPNQSLWANGIDPNVRPAGGYDSNAAVGTVATPSVPKPDDSTGISRGLDKIKGAFGSNPAATAGDGKDQPNANTPYRGTTANGSTVFAGPPAYRWYGWGSVTPGANPNAPTGQYPKVSANWYSITGATPGAFPTPVTNPQRPPSATEPPAYVANTAQRYQASAYVPQTNWSSPPVQNAAPTSTMAELPRPPLTPENRNSVANALPLAPPSDPIPPPASLVPAPPAAPTAPAGMLPPPLSLAPNPSSTIVSPPLPQVPAKAFPTLENSTQGLQNEQPPSLPSASSSFERPIPQMPPPLPLGMLPVVPTTPVPAAEPVAPVADPKATVQEPSAAPSPATAPAALPVSVTDYQLKWQTTTETPGQGEWMSTSKARAASGTMPKPAAPTAPVTAPTVAPTQAPAGSPAANPAPNWQQPGATDTGHAPTIARAQMGESGPDPIVALINRLCEGRAEGVEVRWTGSKRISVCFECRNAIDAQRLVRDISARPELTPYRIDFCVLVK